MSDAFEWQFGGWFRALPHNWSWGILAGVALVGVVVIAVLYRHTLRTLPAGARWTLALMRVGILLVMLVCLANPSRVQSAAHGSDHSRTLAVLVDRSASMDTPDNRGESRLAQSLRIWKPHAAEAQAAFPRIDYFRFSTGVEKADDLSDASASSTPGPETHLYEALDHLLDDPPAAIVALTDGLDTTGATADALAARAQRLGVPLYFAVGSNRLKAIDQLSIAEIRLPATVLRQTNFNPGTLVEITSRDARQVPVQLWSAGKMLASQNVSVRPGANSFAWSPQVTSAEPGPMLLEFRLGADGPAQEVAAGTTQIVAHKTVNVLYYQGALQWGYRFLIASLQSDPSFTVSSILNPALRVRMSTAASAAQSAMPDLPESAADLKNFQIVVLAHVFADQLNPAQQQALVEYARGGGGVLFIMPDTNATLPFSGTPLEQMLPVVFDPPAQGNDQQQDDAARLRSQLDAAGDDGSTDFFSLEDRRQTLPELKPFVAPAGDRAAAELFDQADPPMFSDFAKVHAVKAGAEILALHPDATGTNGQPPVVLLARQRFGSGFAATLATDLLWRWKMSLPSTSRASEKFWQQLMLSLASSGGGRGLRLVKLTAAPALNHLVSFRIEGAGSGLDIAAIAPDGKRRSLPFAETAESGTGGYLAGFTPDAVGRWQVQASDASGGDAHITLPVTEQARTVENSNIPPDIDGLRTLAESTGGALIEDEPIFRAPPTTIDLPEIQHIHPLWNTPWLIGALLGLYGAELITRRCFKLL